MYGYFVALLIGGGVMLLALVKSSRDEPIVWAVCGAALFTTGGISGAVELAAR